MTEHAQHTPSPERNEQKISLDEIFSQVETLDKASGASSKQIQDVLDNYPDVQNNLDTMDPNSTMEQIFDVLHSSLPQETYAALQPALAEYNQTTQELSALEEKHGEHAAAEAARLAHDTLITTDWKAVAEDLASHESKLPRWRVIEGVSAYTHYDKPENLIDTVKKYRCAQELGKAVDLHGLTLETPLPESKQGWYTHGNLISTIEDWQALSEGALAYPSPNRRTWCENHLPTDKLNRLTSNLKLIGADTDTFTLPAPIVDGFEQVAAQEISTFLQAEAQNTAAEHRTMPNMLSISNVTKAGEIMQMETHEVTKMINGAMQLIPPHFTEGIGAVEFIHSPIDKDAEYINNGQHKAQENKIIIDLAGYQDQYQEFLKLGFTSAEAMATAKYKVIGTLVHELGHYAHGKVLTLSELMDWQETLESEPGAISDYVNHVGHLVENEDEDERRLKVEQFADTWKDFILSPAELRKTYPRRFATLNAITKTYEVNNKAAA